MVIRCNGIVFLTILAKDLLLTGMYGRAWVYTVRVGREGMGLL